MAPRAHLNFQQRFRRWFISDRMVWVAPLFGWFFLAAIFGGVAAWRMEHLLAPTQQSGRVEAVMLIFLLLVATFLFLVIWRILVSRQEEARRIARLLEFNALLAQVNQAIAQTENEADLLQAICDLIIRHADLKLAWIGRPDSDGMVQVLASAGASGYLEGMRLSIHAGIPEGQGQTGRAWREGKPFYNPSFEKNPVMRPWAERARLFGLRSSAVLPIARRETQWALLAVYHEKVDVFDHDHQAILEELAKDIGYGLDRIDLHRQERHAINLKESLLTSTTAGIATVRYPERIFVQVNQALLDILGYAGEDDLIGHSTQEIFFDAASYDTIRGIYAVARAQGHAEKQDFAYRRADGTVVYLDVAVGGLMLEEDGRESLTWTVIDVTDRHQLAKELAHQADHDALTGLPNRRALNEEIGEAMARATRHGSLLAVAILDLDGYKPINDAHGHEAGDSVLCIIAHRLRGVVRKTDFVARLGGDEFVLLVEDCADMDELEAVFAKIEVAVCASIVLPEKGAHVTVGLSMGVCLYSPTNEMGPDVLLRYADLALYQSKTHKADRSRYWARYGEAIPQRQNIYQRILAQGGVDVYYQPILNSRRGQIVGIEALARLLDHDGRIFYPEAFLPQLTLEDISNLGELVLSQALTDLAKLDALGWSLWISLNKAPAAFGDHCVSQMAGIIAASGIDPSRITVEILESSDFLEHHAALSVMHALKELGLHLALDDIGSGYASLLRLQELPVDKIKLDQGLIRALEARPQDLHFVRAIQDLAMELQVDLVVEGVEGLDILDAMITMGVPHLQGYAISRPLSFADLQQFLSCHELVDQKRPEGLFGCYAGSMVFHSTIKKMILLNPADLDRDALSDARRCEAHGVLSRLGYNDGSHLAGLHEAYHHALGKVAKLGLGAFNSPEWGAMEAAFAAFMDGILEEWGSRKAEKCVTPI